MLKRLFIFIIILVLMPVFAVNASEADVGITAGEPVYTETGFVTDVAVQFSNREFYNEQVLLSYHVLSEDGTMLVAENQRLGFVLEEDGTARVTVTVNCANLPELEGKEKAIIQFDLVDQKNAFWFLGYPEVDFQGDSIIFDRSLLVQSSPVGDNADEEAVIEPEGMVTEEPAAEEALSAADDSDKHTSHISVAFCLLGWIFVCLVIWRTRSHKGGSGGVSTKKENKISANEHDNLQALSDESRIDKILCKPWFAAVLAVVYFSTPFLVHIDHILAGEALVSGDGRTNGIYLPIYMNESLRNLDFPLWTPYLAGGMPYAGIGSYALLNPAMMISSLMPPVLALCTYFAIHYALGGTFMFLYLKRINCKPVVCLAVSIIFIFQVQMGGPRKEHISIIIASLYVPVILYFLERYLQELKLKWLFLGSGAMALQYLGGHLQYVVYSDLFMFFYLLCSGIHRKISFKQMMKHGTAWVSMYFSLIAVGIIPLAHFLFLNSGSGGESMSFNGFIGYSLHPIKLLMSVFPYMFGQDVWSALLGENFSSGMDAELIIGAAAVSLILAGVVLVRRDFYARFMVSAAAAAFIFACIGQFELLAKIAYRIPVINMLRVPSRSLFLFFFCSLVVLAKSLDALFRSAKHEKIIHLAHAAVGGVILLVIILYYTVGIPYAEQGQSFGKLFQTPVILFGSYLVVFYLGWAIKNKNRYCKNVFQCGVSLSLIAVTLVQVWPFYSLTYNKSPEKQLEFPKNVLENLELNKVIDSRGDFTELLLFNGAIALQVQGLNSYTGYNLPALHKFISRSDSAPMNASGLYQFFYHINSIMNSNYELLSMLGVKYILLRPGAEVQTAEITGYEAEEILIDHSAVSLADAEGYRYAVWPIDLAVDSHYRISLTVEAAEAGGQFYVDFSAVGYDGAEQEQWFTLEEGRHTYTAFLPSQDSSVAENILFRIISLTEREMDIADVRVEKVEPVWEQRYELFAQEEDASIYENLGAKDLVYAPEAVVPISEEEKSRLYLDTQSFDILNTSYITDGSGKYDFSDAAVEISSIKLTNNTVSANYTAEQDAFLNMSQTYYPGWNAYVDGEKTKVYEVNGIIQGAFVPAGEHTIVFKYQPVPFYLGLTVSVLSIVIAVIFGRDKKSKQALSSDKGEMS